MFSESAHSYVVNGDLTCGAARANDSFGDTNAKFFYNRTLLRRVELRLMVRVPKGFYEVLVNYTTPHMKSLYWTEEKIASLPWATQERARKFYSDIAP